jgi:hypothetical protein
MTESERCARCGHPLRVKIAGTNYRTHKGDVGPCALSVVKDPKSGSWGTRCDCPAYVTATSVAATAPEGSADGQLTV